MLYRVKRVKQTIVNISKSVNEYGRFNQTINGSEFANSYFVEKFAPHIFLFTQLAVGDDMERKSGRG